MPKTEKEELIEQVLNIPQKEDIYYSDAELIADWIIADRKRVVRSLVDVNEVLRKTRFMMSANQKSQLMSKAIDETLINAGVRE